MSDLVLVELLLEFGDGAAGLELCELVLDAVQEPLQLRLVIRLQLQQILQAQRPLVHLQHHVIT